MSGKGRGALFEVAECGVEIGDPGRVGLVWGAWLTSSSSSVQAAWTMARWLYRNASWASSRPGLHVAGASLFGEQGEGVVECAGLQHNEDAR
jgi:hypothetical protein